ncbi:hypothetical protein [Campylobacter armoricus]|uniref:Uncharacterized protein n=1 Tax=Campylobacter armoricus TaxID=2505970 RepID=A0A7L5HP70_9BACT|nr:hypothetical protein [Campylobacter armoricus]QKF79064.1 hypothetical protein CARM_0102 [Campylobacter armoricus]
MIKKIFILFILLYIAQAQDTLNKKSEGEGFGISRNEAIKNAINDALKKIDNLRQVKLAKFDFTFNGNFDMGYEEEIDVVSNGIFNSYEIRSLTQTNTNEYHAKIVVYKKLYSEKNFEDKSSLIIVNKIKNNLSSKFEQELLSVLLQGKKFKILDKNHLKIYNQERNILLENNTNNDEIINTYATLGANFLLILNPNIEQIQEETDTQVYKINIEYNLIDFSTMQPITTNILEYKMTSTSEFSKQKALRGIATKITDELFKYAKDNIIDEEEIEYNNQQENEVKNIDLRF